MMKKQNVIKVLTVMLATVSPWIVNASVSCDRLSVSEPRNSAMNEEVNTVIQAALRGEKLSLSNWEKILPSFDPYYFDPEESFDPKTDDEKTEILALQGDERNQKLNSHIQSSIDGTEDDLDCESEDKVEVSGDAFLILYSALKSINKDIQAMVYYEGMLDKETLNNLLSYVSDIPMGEYLLDYKDTVARICVTMLASIPSKILSEGDRKRLNTYCLEIWEKFQNGTLWELRDFSGNIKLGEGNKA